MVEHLAVAESSSSSSVEELDEASDLQVLKFHHLLLGSEHKKEKDMVTQAKWSGLSGMILYGTPGLCVVQCDSAAAAEYLTETRKIGKVGEKVYTVKEKHLTEESACYKKMFESKGLENVNMSQLKAFLSSLAPGHESALPIILGIV